MSELTTQEKIEIMSLAQRATDVKDGIIALYHAMIKAITDSNKEDPFNQLRGDDIDG